MSGRRAQQSHIGQWSLESAACIIIICSVEEFWGVYKWGKPEDEGEMTVIARNSPKIRNIRNHAGQCNRATCPSLWFNFLPLSSFSTLILRVSSGSIELKGSLENINLLSPTVWARKRNGTCQIIITALIDFEGDYTPDRTLSLSLTPSLYQPPYYYSTEHTTTMIGPTLAHSAALWPRKLFSLCPVQLNQSNSGSSPLHKVLKVCAGPEASVSLCVIIIR